MTENLGADGATTVIAVLTFRRNDDLVVAVPRLVDEALSVSPPATVLVVDNDPDGGAAAVVEQMRSDRVRYVNETRPGIAAARNRALHEADARFVVFIDDDMHPEPGWLRALVRTQATYDAVAVAGPVLEEYEIEPGDFIRAGRFFVRRRLPTGTVLDVAASGNLLLDLPLVRRLGVEFDDRFGLLGGSDHLFTRTLAHRGALMVWCDEAITYDRVPASRISRRWVLRRAYRVGNTQTLVSILLAGSAAMRLRVRMRAVAGGTARVVLGAARATWGRLSRSAVHEARGTRAAWRGAGMVAASWGSKYVEYARPAVGDGSSPAS